MRKFINIFNNKGNVLNLTESTLKNPSCKLNKEIDNIIESYGYKIDNIYDIENIKGSVCAIKLNNIIPNFLYEGIDFKLDNPGGIIIFSTDLNSTLGNADTLFKKIKLFFVSKWKTILNRINTSKRLDKILLNKHKLPAFTVGQKFKGHYTGKNGLSFNEKSYTVDIAGVESKFLELIATTICKEFKQESVMVRDFNKNKVFFVNQK